MIRFLRAFAWLRWRLMLNAVRGSARRDAWEQLSRILALTIPAIVVVMSFSSIVAVAIGGMLGGNALATGRFVAPDVIIFVIRAVLFGAMAMVMLMPIGSAAQTTSTRYSRFMLLPILAKSLHFVEVLANLADPWILFILPGLALFAAGLAWGDRFDLALLAAGAGLALAVVLASLAALIGFSVSWLFRDRRRAELLTIISVMSISIVALLPQFLGDNLGEGSGRRGRGGPLTVQRIDQLMPDWMRVLPSELYGGVLTASVVQHDRARAITYLAVLASEGIVFFWLSGLVHRRLLESSEGAAGGRQRVNRMRPPWRLPGFTAPAGAVAWVMFRNSMRSVRGRVAVLLPGPMMAIVALMLLRRPNEAPWIAALGTHSHMMFAGSLLVSLFAIHPFMLNQFSSDRSGLTLQLLLPVSARDLVRGKAIGGGALFLMATVFAAVASALATGGGSLSAWVMTAVGGLATYVAVTPVATLLSALFPVAADMSKTGSGGNPHVASAFIGMVGTGLAALPALIIGVPGLLPGATPTISLLAMIAWLMVAAAIAWVLLGAAAHVVSARRENLFLTK